MSARCGLERMQILQQLAASIYYASEAMYHRDGLHFDALDPNRRHLYIELAEDDLQRLAPLPSAPPLFDLAVSLARSEAAKVVGRITPDGSR